MLSSRAPSLRFLVPLWCSASKLMAPSVHYNLFWVSIWLVLCGYLFLLCSFLPWCCRSFASVLPVRATWFPCGHIAVLCLQVELLKNFKYLAKIACVYICIYMYVCKKKNLKLCHRIHILLYSSLWRTKTPIFAIWFVLVFVLGKCWCSLIVCVI